MVERTTKLATNAASEDVALVANKPTTAKVDPSSRPVFDEKTKEIQNIERNKRKSFVQNVGQKVIHMIIIFYILIII